MCIFFVYNSECVWTRLNKVLNNGGQSWKIYFDHHYPLREKCPNTEFFLVRIFLHSDWIRRDTSPNAGKYGPEKTPYFDTFHAVIITVIILINMIILIYRETSLSVKQKKYTKKWPKK